jgi:hypothetical protein
MWAAVGGVAGYYGFKEHTELVRPCLSLLFVVRLQSLGVSGAAHGDVGHSHQRRIQ